jgi:hypothetical protein
MVLAASTSAFDQPGTLGFLVVFGMGVALYFVFRSMARHLRKVNTVAREEAAAAARAESSAAGPAAPADGPPSR